MITPEERAELTREITEHILLILPGVISHLINNMATLKDASAQFYEKNKDLIPHKAIVGATIEQFESKYPGKDVSEILDLAAQEVRQLITRQTKARNAPSISVERLDKVLGNL